MRTDERTAKERSLNVDYKNNKIRPLEQGKAGEKENENNECLKTKIAEIIEIFIFLLRVKHGKSGKIDSF